MREGRTRTIRPARDIQRDPLTRTPGGPVALTMEAARVLGPVDVPNIAQPNIFSRILLEDMPLPQPSVTAGSKQPKSRRQRRAERAGKGAPRTVLNSNLPPITSRIFGAASKLFSFDKTVHVISLKDLKENTTKYTEGNYKAIAAWLENTVDRMETSPTQGRYLPTGDAHVIVLNDLDVTPGQESDARLGAVLSHEIGHIVFQEEFQKILDNPALKKRLWDSFKQHLENMDRPPTQYSLTKEGFEEWYADQVASYVYDQAKSAKTGTDSYFKSIAKKLANFFEQVNAMLGGRLEQNEVFKEYMDGVVATHRNNRKAIISDSDGKVLGMAEQIGVREMIQEITAQDWFPTVQKNYQALTARIMRTPTYKFLNKWLSSTDGWLRDQGEAGIELAKFFNNKSSSLEETGFHQAKTIMFNRLTNRLGAIFEMDVTENEKAWDDPLVEEALSLAEDERITDAELAARTDEAAQKAVLVRKLFSDIFDEYIVNPKTKIPFFYIKKRETTLRVCSTL